MTKAVWGARIRLAGVLILIVLTTSCGDMVRQGTGSSYLIIRQLSGVAADGTTGNTLDSDVVTVINDVPTILDDPGTVTFGLGMKDSSLTATSANWITVDRYHVTFIRADGRNTPGVDVPYPFDGAFTVTVAGDAGGGFIWVRHQAKAEAPLLALARNGIIISTIAEITFYGHDQSGREVSATGHMSVSFGNYGDK